jgi:drug/metabolite transporter (DMT)-like permease
MSLRVWFWLLSLSALWGGTFFFAKVALAELPPFTVVFARVALAAVALNVALIATSGGLFRGGRPWRAFFAMALLNNAVPFSLIAWGQTQIGSGLASILNATTPLFTVMLAHFLTGDEKITGAKAAALLAGLAGVVLLIGPDVLYDGATGVRGQFACMAASLCYAFAGIYGRRFQSLGIRSMEAAAGQVTASAMLILPIMVVVDRPWELAVPSPTVCVALAAAALLSTALGYVLYFRILAAAGATNLLLVTFLMPAMAILLGSAVLGERLEPRHFAGMSLIGVGLAVIDGRIAKALRPAK